MKARVLAVLFSVFVLAQTCQAAMAQQDAKTTLKATVDEVVSILNSSKPGDAGRTDRLYTAVSKVFDPEELARRTLASHWESFNPEERKRFTDAFVRLLQNTYLRRIENYTNEQVIFLEESSLAANRSEVGTKIISSGKEIPIVYRLIKKDEWKVYDVVIEGVSLVQNYRNQFNQILAKESPAQLIARVESMSSSS